MACGGMVRLALGLLKANTYIVPCDNGALIVDPGAERDKILACLDKLGKEPEYVLLTHGHYDHIGCAGELKRLGAKVIISQKDFDLLGETDFMLGLGVPVERFDADITVKGGDELMLDGRRFAVAATPGHTPGSVCYFMDGETVFTGDTLFCRGIGRYDLPYGSGADMIRSLKALFSRGGDIDVCPGHGITTTLDAERKFNPYAEF